MNSCPCCKASSWQNFRKVKRDHVFQKFKICKNCLLIKNDSCLSYDELKSYYKESYNTKNYKADNDDIFKRMLIPSRHRINLLAKNNFNPSKGENLLEIGPGSGSMLFLLSKKKINIKAVEPDPVASNWLKKFPYIKVINKFFEEWIIERNNLEDKEKFDWIIITHVLEHIKVPGNFLKELKILLKKTGKIIIEVPNANNPYSDGKNWGHLFDPGHFYYYTKNNLRELIINSGLNIDFISDSTMKPYKNILCVATANKTKTKIFSKNQNQNINILKLKAIWKIFEISHLIRELFIKKPGRFFKYKILRFHHEKKQ